MHEIINKEIYKRVYRTTMSNNGDGYGINEEAFLSVCGADPYKIKIEEFMELSGASKLQAIYLRMLNRIPDDAAKERYEKLVESFGEEAATYIMFDEVGNSWEFEKTGKKKQGNGRIKVIMMQNGLKKKYYRERVKSHLMQVRSFLHFKFVEPVWIRMPKPIKNFIRVLCGREKK